MPKNSSPPGQDFQKRMERVLGSSQESKWFFEALRNLAQTRLGRVLRPNPRAAPADWKALLGSMVGGPVPWCPEARFWHPEWESPSQDSSEAKFLKLLQGAGALWIQEGAATEVVAALPDLPRGARVLDLCAAPGSKSSHLWDRFGADVELWCHDAVPSRALRLNALLARWGANAFKVSTGAVDHLADHLADRGAEDRFELIVLDAPCSGETLFAKRMDERKDISDREVREASLTQRHLLNRACGMVKPGGFVMYSTCAYNQEENEDVVSHVLQQRVTMGEVWVPIKAQRRWPHRDGVPGGAWFLLRKQSESERPKESRSRFLKGASFQILSSNSKGTDLEVRGFQDAREHWPRFEVDDAVALQLLQGQSVSNNLNLKGNVCISWRGLPLVPVHAIADRLNNRLPKRLREL